MIALVAALGLMLQPNSGFRPNQTVDATTLHKKVLSVIKAGSARAGMAARNGTIGIAIGARRPRRTRWTGSRSICGRT